MKCPYCGSAGFPREFELSSREACRYWICTKCPNPVSYHSDKKKICIWVLYNDSWYSIVYLPTLKKYVVMHETFDLCISDDDCKEEYRYNGSIIIQLPCEEENVTPANAQEKLALWLTFS